MRLFRFFLFIGLGVCVGLGVAQSNVPTAKCDFHGGRADALLRQISGSGKVPYWFACGVRNGSACIAGSLPAGLVVSVDSEEGGWSCVTGGDSTSGWVETTRLESVPSEPKVPLEDWMGWWRQGKPTKEMVDGGDVLLLARGSRPGSIRVSGKAVWYGAVVDGQHVEHFGQVNGEAVPVGRHLHVVEGNGDDSGNGCVLDLSLNTGDKTPILSAYDNMQCGGMNVGFGGQWTRFTPKSKLKKVLMAK
jgi:hypothetical protein